MSVWVTVVYGQGKYDEAGQFYQRALAITEKVYGPNHPEVAQSMNNQATLLFKQVRTVGTLSTSRALYKHEQCLMIVGQRWLLRVNLTKPTHCMSEQLRSGRRAWNLIVIQILHRGSTIGDCCWKRRYLSDNETTNYCASRVAAVVLG